MGQDLRELFKKKPETKTFTMKEGHEGRFLKRLEKELPKKPTMSYTWVGIAASIALVVSLAIYFVNPSTLAAEHTVVEKGNTESTKTEISLGDLSPDLKKVENYYVANINYELSQLTVSDENKEMVDGFMDRLVELDAEYRTLNAELNTLGPNDETISALIQNLQLRLQLLQKLKQKLNQLKSSENEQESHII